MNSSLSTTGAQNFMDAFYPGTELQVLMIQGGQIVEAIDLGSNTITNLGRANMAHLWAGDDVTNRAVYSMKLGDAGHNPSNPVEALATSPTDTDLFGSEIIEKVLSFEFPDGDSANRVTFTAEVTSEEANGGGAQAISEIGLYDVTGRMLSHKTFGLITKTSVFGLLFRYSFIF